MIKQWTAARRISFSVMVFSLTMLAHIPGYAQDYEEDLAPALEADDNADAQTAPSPAVLNREAQRVSVQGTGQAAQSSLSTQPVSVTSSMSPTQVPVAMPARGYTQQRVVEQPQGLIVGAPSTGIGGSNPGNANTGGVQVQSVTVQANPTADAANTANVGDILRRHRVRNEVDNENRLIERLEMGRLEDERMRAQSIDGFQSSVGNSASANNNSQAASAQTSGDQSPAAAVAAGPGSTVNVQQVAPVDSVMDVHPVGSTGTLHYKHDGDVDLNATTFGISPFLGYRWYSASNYYFDVKNKFVSGVTMDGWVNRYFGIEGNFTYARDEISDISGIGGSYGGVPGGSYYYGAPIRERETFEVGLAAKVGSAFGRVRPFGVIGFGARQSRYDIDDPYTTQLAEQAGWQRSTNKALGLFGAGLDIRLAPHVSLGGRFDYQAVLNKNTDYMDMLYNDSSNSYQGVGTLRVSF